MFVVDKGAHDSYLHGVLNIKNFDADWILFFAIYNLTMVLSHLLSDNEFDENSMRYLFLEKRIDNEIVRITVILCGCKRFNIVGAYR